MQPRDRQVLEHITEYCADIEASVSLFGNSFDRFCATRAFQYTVAFCILQIAELASKLSTELRSASESEMNWRQIRGMRNIVVHDYGAVDPEVVWGVVVKDVPKLKAFCSRMLETNDSSDL